MSAHNHDRQRRAGQAGFSIIELMVAMVISLLVSLTALGAAQSFLASQRQSTSVGTAYANAVAATAAMKVEAAQAGLGIFVDGTLPCLAMNLSTNATVISDATLFLPVSVVSTALDKTTVTVAYSTLLEGGTPGFLRNDSTSTGASIEMSNYLPVPDTSTKSQAVVLAPPGAVDGTCTIRSVTSVTAPAGGVNQVLNFANTGQHNKAAFTSSVDYPANSRVFLLGEMRISRFTLKDGALTMTRPLENQSAVLARDVIAFTAQYGITDGVTDSLQSWEDPSGTWAALDAVKLQKIKALRLGVVVRTSQREKPDAAGNCSASTDQPMVFDKTMALTGDWQCFKYRTVTIVVPLRNLMLGADAS